MRIRNGIGQLSLKVKILSKVNCQLLGIYFVIYNSLQINVFHSDVVVCVQEYEQLNIQYMAFCFCNGRLALSHYCWRHSGRIRHSSVTPMASRLVESQ
jgi:hypothetical protein